MCTRFRCSANKSTNVISVVPNIFTLVEIKPKMVSSIGKGDQSDSFIPSSIYSLIHSCLHSTSIYSIPIMLDTVRQEILR